MKRIDRFLLLVYGAIALFCVMILGSCSPQLRIQKLLRNHPEMLNVSYDTSIIYIQDSVLVTYPGRDTIVSFRDSLVLKDSISITTLTKYANGTQRIKTVYKKVPVYFRDTIKTVTAVNKTIKVGASKEDIHKYRRQGRNQIITLVSIIFIVLIVLYLLFKYYKPFKLF